MALDDAAADVAADDASPDHDAESDRPDGRTPGIDRDGRPDIDLEPADGADPSWRATAGRADGRRRRRQGALVIGIALASAAGGILIGTRIKSPADEAAARQAPPPSRITVPVERQLLSSSLVLSGEVRYNEPTPVKLAGSVGVEEGEAEVITAVPELDQLVQEGDVLLEVTGRPVFVLQGELPMYRRLSNGSEGPDVQQLETALARLGFAPGNVDTVFDAATASAVTELYSTAGYEAEGPSRAQRDEIRTARQAVTDAEESLRAARDDLDRNVVTVPESQLFQLRQAVTSAESAVPAAEQSAKRSKDEAAQAARTATVSRDAARTILDSARTIRNAAAAPGAIDPDTGEPPTAARLAQLAADVAAADENLAQAEQALATAIDNQAATETRVAAEVEAARANLELARLQLAEATEPVDTSAEQAAVDQAQQNLDSATADLQQLEAIVGLRVSPGELLFVPITPTNVTELYVVPGSPATDQLGTLSTAETLVVSRVSRGDSGLVSVGASVLVELRDVDVETGGTIISIGAPTENPNDPNSGGASSGGGSSRLEVVVAPDDPALLSDFVFSGARVTIDVASSDGEVLTVPVAALTVGPDGASIVEVETAPVTEADPGSTLVVEVEVGLTAQGLVEVRSDDLHEGDQVVVGTETGRRRDLEGSNADDSGA